MSISHDNPAQVAWDDLTLEDDVALLKGHRYTGVIVSYHDNGALASRRNYHDGLPEGVSEEWYPNGQLEKRVLAVAGKGASEIWTWYPDGKPWSYRRNHDRWPVELKEWSPVGELVKDERHESS